MKHIILLICLCFSMIHVGFAGPHFTTLEGQKLYGQDLKGKWIVLEYWASWCDICMSELPDLQRLYESLDKQKVHMYLVNYDGLSARKINQIFSKNHLHIPSLKGNPAQMFGIRNVDALPMTIVINPQGQVHKVLYGPEANRKILKIIK